MAKDMVRVDRRGAGVESSRVAIPDAGWTLYPIVQPRKDKFPMFARLLADEYEDAEFSPAEVPALKWEAGQRRELVRTTQAPLTMGLASASPSEVMRFLADVRRLADEAIQHGEGIFAAAD